MIAQTLSNISTWVVAHPDGANLIPVSFVVLVALWMWVAKPPPLKEHVFASHALGFWVLAWVTFVAIYVLRLALPNIGAIWQLVLVDVQSFFAFYFGVAYLNGKDYKAGNIWLTLFVSLGLWVIVFPVGLGLWVANEPSGSGWREVWILPSQALSVTGLAMLGGAFVIRYGKIALPMLIITALYASLQRPVFVAVFVDQAATPTQWFVALAFWKILMGTGFYLYFFAPLAVYEARSFATIDSFTSSLIKRRLRRVVLYFIGPVTAVVLEEVVRNL